MQLSVGLWVDKLHIFTCYGFAVFLVFKFKINNNMEHQINDFKKEYDTLWFEDQDSYSREEVKSLLYSQIAKIHNDVNNIIYSNMKAETTDKGEKLREWNKEESEIMECLKNPRCVNF